MDTPNVDWKALASTLPLKSPIKFFVNKGSISMDIFFDKNVYPTPISPEKLNKL